jgi:nucleoside triphosphate diphosphatase
MSSSLSELLAIMERLRGVGGCPWDRAQTFASIAPYTIEESYEVADAIERGDLAHLKDELGDLLFQVVFHAQIAREAGHFDFDAVAAAIRDKLVRRHPHVFAPDRANGNAGPLSIGEQNAVWEDIKAQERASAVAPGGADVTPSGADVTLGGADVTLGGADVTLGGADVTLGGADIKGHATQRQASASALDGVPLALPALMRAFKLSKRAARVGFDFAHASETADKVAEELAEVREAAAAGSATAAQETFEEIGDLLFAAANLARKLDVDAEAALRAANGKFERRFHGMERLAAQRGDSFEALDLAAQEALWQEVKRAE